MANDHSGSPAGIAPVGETSFLSYSKLIIKAQHENKRNKTKRKKHQKPKRVEKRQKLFSAIIPSVGSTDREETLHQRFQCIRSPAQGRVALLRTRTRMMCSTHTYTIRIRSPAHACEPPLRADALTHRSHQQRPLMDIWSLLKNLKKIGKIYLNIGSISWKVMGGSTQRINDR